MLCLCATAIYHRGVTFYTTQDPPPPFKTTTCPFTFQFVSRQMEQDAACYSLCSGVAGRQILLLSDRARPDAHTFYAVKINSSWLSLYVQRKDIKVV